MSVTRTLRVTTPKDLTTALVKMDLKATAKTARVIFFLRAKQTAYRRGPYGKGNPAVNFYINFFFFCLVNGISVDAAKWNR